MSEGKKVHEALYLSEEEARRRVGYLSGRIAHLLVSTRGYSDFAEKMAEFYDELDYKDKQLIWVNYVSLLGEVGVDEIWSVSS